MAGGTSLPIRFAVVGTSTGRMHERFLRRGYGYHEDICVAHLSFLAGADIYIYILGCSDLIWSTRRATRNEGTARQGEMKHVNDSVNLSFVYSYGRRPIYVVNLNEEGCCLCVFRHPSDLGRLVPVRSFETCILLDHVLVLFKQTHKTRCM